MCIWYDHIYDFLNYFTNFVQAPLDKYFRKKILMIFLYLLVYRLQKSRRLS